LNGLNLRLGQDHIQVLRHTFALHVVDAGQCLVQRAELGLINQNLSSS